METTNINKTRKPRGYCILCGKRTCHQEEDGFTCVICSMGLEDKIQQKDKRILSIVKKSGLGSKELGLLLNQPKQFNSKKVYDHSVKGKVKIGIISDTHIGHAAFDEALFKYSAEIFKKEGVQNVYHSGDILEGMSGREGHVYELDKLGFKQQIDYAEKLFKKHYKGLNVFGITGNHDHWYKNKNNAGINVGEALQSRVPNFTYLGENEALVKLGHKTNMLLFHANDGTAYATSYKLQKLIESFTGGEKPNVVVEGHYHKAMYMFNRNVHGVEAGTLCSQTPFMRGKKIPAHKGFWVLEMDIGQKGIKKFSPHFFPAYD